MIIIKTDEEVELMAAAGKVTATALEAVKKAVRPGVSTYELDKIAYDSICSQNAKPAFLNYGGFPGSICTSLNSEVVHGIPSKHVILKSGDIVSIDIGAVYKGYVGDMGDTVAVGEISDTAAKLIEAARKSFYTGLEYAKEGCRLSDISHAVQSCAESYGFSVVRDYVGHGVGHEMHEDPSVPNYGQPGHGVRLRKGLVIAIEPMINEGVFDVELCDDNWTVCTADGKLSAYYEHTVAITDGQPRILTLV